MNADQFFFLMFSTFTKREIFGQLTFYYCEVIMYSLQFGMTMFFMHKFTINSCMFYRNSLLAMLGLVCHLFYMLTKMKNILIANFCLYIIYLSMDAWNDKLTHIGMKLCGKIKDDDSFEGDFPMRFPRKKLEMKPSQWAEIDSIIEKHEAMYLANLRPTNTIIRIKLEKEQKIRHFSDEELERRLRLRKIFARAVLKLVIYLRSYLEDLLNNREISYKNNLKIAQDVHQGNANFSDLQDLPQLAGGTTLMENNEEFKDYKKIEELSEEQNESDRMSDRFSVRSSERFSERSIRKGSTCKFIDLTLSQR